MNTDSIQLVINTIGTALSKYGPQALETMLSVVRYQGLGAIIIGLTLWVTSIPLCVFAFHCWKRAGKVERFDSTDWRFAASICFIGFAVLHLFAGSFLFNIWTWVAIFDPKIALAHQILTQIGTKQ